MTYLSTGLLRKLAMTTLRLIIVFFVARKHVLMKKIAYKIFPIARRAPEIMRLKASMMCGAYTHGKGTKGTVCALLSAVFWARKILLIGKMPFGIKGIRHAISL